MDELEQVDIEATVQVYLTWSEEERNWYVPTHLYQNDEQMDGRLYTSEDEEVDEVTMGRATDDPYALPTLRGLAELLAEQVLGLEVTR